MRIAQGPLPSATASDASSRRGRAVRLGRVRRARRGSRSSAATASRRSRRLGFPSLDDEEWRYTNLAPARAHGLRARPARRLDRRADAGASSSRRASARSASPRPARALVFVNGRLVRADGRTALPPEVLFENLATRPPGSLPSASSERSSRRPTAHPFVALNDAFLDTGALVHVGKGARGAGTARRRPRLDVRQRDASAAHVAPAESHRPRRERVRDRHRGLPRRATSPPSRTPSREAVLGDERAPDARQGPARGPPRRSTSEASASPMRRRAALGLARLLVRRGARPQRDRGDALAAKAPARSSTASSSRRRASTSTATRSSTTRAPHGDEPRALQGDPRRERPRRLRRARSSSAPGAVKTDARQTNRNLILSNDGARRQQAPARDPQQRRPVHARLDDGPPRRRRRSSTSARAASSEGGGARPPDLRLRQRDRRRRSPAADLRASSRTALHAWLARGRRGGPMSVVPETAVPGVAPAVRRRADPRPSSRSSARRVHGKPLVYLDNANTTQKPRAVIDADRRYYEETNANIHRGDALPLARRRPPPTRGPARRSRRFLGARAPKEIVFTRGTTEAINLVAAGFATGVPEGRRRDPHHGPRAPLEHRPVAARSASGTGAKLVVVPITDSGEVPVEEFEKRLVGPDEDRGGLARLERARDDQPRARSSSRSRTRGACPSSSTARRPRRTSRSTSRDLGCDFYAVSAHKMYGPTGIGALYGTEEWLEKLPPYQGGGDMIASVTFEKTTYNELPWKFEAGTANIAGGIGFGVAIDWLTAVGLPAVAAHEHDAPRPRDGGALGDRGPADRRDRAGEGGRRLVPPRRRPPARHRHDPRPRGNRDPHGPALRAARHGPLRHPARRPAPRSASTTREEEVDALATALRKVQEIFG